MRCVDRQRYVLRLHQAQVCILDEASMAMVQMFRQAEQRAAGEFLRGRALWCYNAVVAIMAISV